MTREREFYDVWLERQENRDKKTFILNIQNNFSLPSWEKIDVGTRERRNNNFINRNDYYKTCYEFIKKEYEESRERESEIKVCLIYTT